MTAPPPNEAAAAVLEALATAQREDSTAILSQDEEERKYARLEVRACRAGCVLMRVPSGYMLVRGSASHHSSSLDTIAHALAHREAG